MEPCGEPGGTWVAVLPVNAGGSTTRDAYSEERRAKFVRDLVHEDDAANTGQQVRRAHEHARTWTDPRDPTSAVRDIEDAARFLDPVVYLRHAHGRVHVFAHHDFFEDLCHVEHYADCVLAVVNGGANDRGTLPDVVHPAHDTCLDGRTFAAGLAHTVGTNGRLWSVRARIGEAAVPHHRYTSIECSLADAADRGTTNGIGQLERWTEELREASWQALYQAMGYDRDSAPRFADRKRADEMGIHLPDPFAELHPWRARTAAQDDPRLRRLRDGRRRTARGDTVLVDEDLDAVRAQLLDHALEHARSRGGIVREQCMEPCPALEG